MRSVSKERGGSIQARLTLVVSLFLAATACTNSLDLREEAKTAVMKANDRYLVASLSLGLDDYGTFSPTGYVSIAFDRPLRLSTATASTLQVLNVNSGEVLADDEMELSYFEATNTLKIRALPYLDIAASYKLTVAGLLGKDGSALQEPVTATFTTSSISAGTIDSIASSDSTSSAGYSKTSTVTISGTVNDAHAYVSYRVGWVDSKGDLNVLKDFTRRSRGDAGSFALEDIANVPEGTITLKVEFTGYDVAGGGTSFAGDSATGSIIVDLTPPTAPAVTAATPTNAPSWTWSGGGSADGANIYRYSLDGGDWLCPAAQPALSYSATLADGTSHSLEVQERDLAGNWSAVTTGSTASLLVDLTPPAAPSATVDASTTTVVRYNSIDYTNNQTPTVGWAAVDGASRYRCSVDDGSWQDIAACSFTTATLTNGAHSLAIQAGDAAGNWSASLPSASTWSWSFTVEATNPSAPVMSGTSPTNNTTPTWSWSGGGNGIGLFRYQFAGGAWSAETSATSYTPASALAEGSYLLAVEERDNMGDWSAAASKTIVVDTTAPTYCLVNGWYSSSTKKVLVGVHTDPAEGVAAVTVTYSGVLYQTTSTFELYIWTTPATYIWSPSVTISWVSGQTGVVITVMDAAGNVLTKTASLTSY
jgi:hypothetical protein